jgi:DNA polymerase-3 subunit epsilon
MRILFFDTETTGLPKDWKAPLERLDNWPRLVQIAWQVYNQEGDLLAEHEYIIKPVGFIIPSEASAVHNITTAKALETGVDLITILKVFSSSVKSCGLLVAHNYSYDYNIMGSELLRNGLENTLKNKEHICTMNASTDFCKISGPYGYKWPKLEELHEILFSESFNAHNALDDIKATARCFWELEKNKIIVVTNKIGFNINLKDWNTQYLRSLLRNFKNSSSCHDFCDEFSNKKFIRGYENEVWMNGIDINVSYFWDAKHFKENPDDPDDPNWTEKVIDFTGTCIDIRKDATGCTTVRKYHYYKGSLIRFKAYNNGRLIRATKLYNNIVWEDIEFYLDDSNLEEEVMIIDLELEDYDDLKNYLTKKFEYSCLKYLNCEHTKRINYARDGSVKSIWNYEGYVLKNIQFNRFPDKGKTEDFSQLKKIPFTMKINPYKLKFENWECNQEFFSEKGNFKLLHTYHFTPLDWYKPANFDGFNLVNYGYSQVIYKCEGNLHKKQVPIKSHKQFNNKFIGKFSDSSVYTKCAYHSEEELLRETLKEDMAANYSDDEIENYVEEYIKFISSFDKEIETPIYHYALGVPYDIRGEMYWVDDDEEFLIWRSKFHDAKPGDYYYQGHLSKEEEEEWELRNRGAGFYSPGWE